MKIKFCFIYSAAARMKERNTSMGFYKIYVAVANRFAQESILVLFSKLINNICIALTTLVLANRPSRLLNAKKQICKPFCNHPNLTIRTKKQQTKALEHTILKPNKTLQNCKSAVRYF